MAPPADNSSGNTLQNILEAGEWGLYTKWVDENLDNDDVLAEFEMDPPPGVDERLHQTIDSADARINQLERLMGEVINQNQILVQEIRGMVAILATARERSQPLPAPAPEEAIDVEVLAQPSTTAPNVTEMLRQAARPRVPIVQIKMPSSFNEIWQEWERNNLASFRNTKKASEVWSSSIYNAWNRRRKIMETIQAKAAAANVSFGEQLRAIDADREQRNVTTSTVLKEWREQDRRNGAAGVRKSPVTPRGQQQGCKKRRRRREPEQQR